MRCCGCRTRRRQASQASNLMWITLNLSAAALIFTALSIDIFTMVTGGICVGILFFLQTDNNTTKYAGFMMASVFGWGAALTSGMNVWAATSEMKNHCDDDESSGDGASFANNWILLLGAASVAALIWTSVGILTFAISLRSFSDGPTGTSRDDDDDDGNTVSLEADEKPDEDDIELGGEADAGQGVEDSTPA